MIFVENVRNVDWIGVYSADEPEVSLTALMNIFMRTVNRHAFIYKKSLQLILKQPNVLI